MLQSYTAVDAALRAEVDALLDACESADGFRTELYTDASINAHRGMPCAFAARRDGALAGFLFVFAPTAAEVEINAAVHPAHRRQGLFKAMLAVALDEARAHGYSRGYLFCNGEAKDAVAVMGHWGLRLSHAEYQMRYQIPSPPPEDDGAFRLTRLTAEAVPAVAPLVAECFGKPVQQEEAYLANSLSSAERANWLMVDREGAVAGFVGEYRDGQGMNLFGLGIVPALRRRGYGKKLLDLAARHAHGLGIGRLNLDVDSANPAAIALYRTYGFETTSATNYFELVF